MKKAEESRKVRMATEKAAKKEKELEYQQREAEKKWNDPMMFGIKTLVS
jgi:hypothetical protein